MSLRTPLARAKGLGGAKEGSHHWWMQRLSAVALGMLSVWFVSVMIWTGGGDRVLSLVSSPFHAIALILFMTVALYHGYLGMKVVIEDYVHANTWKVVMVTSIAFLTLLTGVALVLAIVTSHISMQRNDGGYKGRRGHHDMCGKGDAQAYTHNKKYICPFKEKKGTEVNSNEVQPTQGEKAWQKPIQ